MLCVDLFLAVAVSTMQSLNGGREPGHSRCRHRGRMMRGDAAAVTGAVPAVSLAATPFQLFAHRPLPVSHALGCRGHGLQAPSPPWGGCHTKLPDRAPVPQDVGPRQPDLVHGRPKARSRRSMERDVESRLWRSSSVAGAHSSTTRAATKLLQNGVARRPHARRAAARETRRGGAQGRTAGAQQGSAARWRGREARPVGAAERSEEDGGGRPAEPAVAAETPRSSRPTELEPRRGRPWSSCS